MESIDIKTININYFYMLSQILPELFDGRNLICSAAISKADSSCERLNLSFKILSLFYYIKKNHNYTLFNESL